MTKGDKELTGASEARSDESARPSSAPPSSSSPSRKVYRAPSVQKRRSLVHATLVSGGGTGGALAGGAP